MNTIYDILQARELIDKYLISLNIPTNKPQNLYEPIDYYLKLGGKRIRSVILLQSFQLFNIDVSKSLPLAAAIELFHTSALIHDDYIDDADIRRGRITVNRKFGGISSILSGDNSILLSMKEIIKEKYPNQIEILNTFLSGAEEVLKGQRMDVDIGSHFNITFEDYIKMIEFKTANFIGVSLKIGALAGGATVEDANTLYKVGSSFGLAFQLKDDILDCYGDQSKLGILIGGDIIRQKRTSLLVKFLEVSDNSDKTKFLKIFCDPSLNHDLKIERVLEYYNKYNIKDLIEEQVLKYKNIYIDAFEKIKVAKFRKKTLKLTIDTLFTRTGQEIETEDLGVDDFLLLIEKHLIFNENLNFEDKLSGLLHEFDLVESSDKQRLLDLKKRIKKKFNKKVKIFISYSHKDELFKERLDKALYALKRKNKVEIWEDRKIIAGQQWEDEILYNLENSEIVLLLLSDDYISSDFCYTKEFKLILRDHIKRQKVIIPIIIRPCSWKELEFEKIQVVPKDGKPITTWENQDLAWVDVVKKIKNTIEDFLIINYGS